MFDENTCKEPFSNQALESCFAHLRNLEHGRHTFQSMLSRAVIMKNQSVSVWLRQHQDRPDMIRKILKTRQSSKRNSQQIEADSFEQRLNLSQSAGAKKTK